MSIPMSPTTLDDDDPERPPPSAQPIQHRISRGSAVDPRHGSQTSGVPRRGDCTVSQPPRVATHSAVDHSSSSRMHNHHTPSAARTNPPPSSQPAAKPSASSAHVTPLLTSGVASAARTFFYPWNSVSTGHQRAENRLSGSTSWRKSRSLKLAEQYKGGLGGGERVADTVGVGSEDFGTDGRLANGGWEKGARGLRTGGQKSLAEVWGKSKAMTVVARSSQEKQQVADATRSESLSGTEEIDLHHEGEYALRTMSTQY